MLFIMYIISIMIPMAMAMANTQSQIMIERWKAVFLIWIIIAPSVKLSYAPPLPRIAPMAVSALQSTFSLDNALEAVAHDI